MSEPRLISPLLDGYLMGDPISDHHGVRSCPAIREGTEERAIIKIISVPASPAQLDALLLTGALPDAERAKSYFHDRAEEVIKEAQILSKLSRSGGFLPYQSSQIVPMEEGVGFEVYLLAPYQRSLREQILDGKMTHLAAANLGLDMCAALTVCRRAGYLYTDLRPENIFLCQNRGYCIGDLGLMRLASLKYASLPEKYRSRYTPPEITDAYAALNDTLDVYALGLVLYQVYNDGELPPSGEPLVPPMYADYELAEIILKACAPDPADRWTDPSRMGQALVDHMQRNVINDDPIVPPPPEPAPVPEEEEEAFLTEEENALELAELLASIPDEEIPSEDQPFEEADTDASMPQPETQDEDPEPETNSSGTTEEQIVADDDTNADGMAESSAYPRTELTEDGLTVEVAQMLAQADELLSMELPEPVVAPDPIEVPIPPPIVPEPETEEPATSPDPQSELSTAEPDGSGPEDDLDQEPVSDPTQDDDPEDLATEDDASGEDIPDPAYDPELQLKKRRIRWWITVIAAITSLVVAFFIGRYLYQNYFLLTIDDLTVTGAADQIFVSLVTKADEDKLTVVCTDTYGNTLRSPVTDGKAVFSSLNANTQYKIQVQIDGEYQLMGHTTGAYTTAARTQILDLAAISGPENGSVILSFTVDGPDSDRWKVEYYAPGIKIRTTSFVGKHITLTGLDTAVEYTFRIIPEDELYITGTDTICFRPQKAIYAQDLRVTAYEGDTMTVAWSVPSDTPAQNWIVRCYGEGNYDQSFTTNETICTFQGIDPSVGYTVTVMAAGMTKGQSITVSADPVHVTAFHPDRVSPWALELRWDYTGTLPEGGWKLSCSIDGGAPITSLCPENSTTLPLAPGSTYTLEVHPAGDVTYFSMEYRYGPVETVTYSGHDVVAEHMALSLHPQPTGTDWTVEDIHGTEAITSFKATDPVYLLIQLSKAYVASSERVTTSFVIRNSKNSLISSLESVQTWNEMWQEDKFAVKIPQLPEAPGTYTMDVYLQEQYVSSLSFTIT